MPVAVTVAPLYELIQERYATVNPVFVSDFMKATASYCAYLKGKGQISNCDNPRPDLNLGRRLNLLTQPGVTVSLTDERQSAYRAIDGNSKDCYFEGPNASATSSEIWASRYDAKIFTADIKRSKFIKTIKVTGVEGHQWNFDKVEVRVGNSNNFFENPLCEGRLANVVTQEITCNLTGKFIAFREQNYGDYRKPQLVFCEIEAYSN
jgi:hypothetical protein